jgi:hypothetical protein
MGRTVTLAEPDSGISPTGYSTVSVANRLKCSPASTTSEAPSIAYAQDGKSNCHLVRV